VLDERTRGAELLVVSDRSSSVLCSSARTRLSFFPLASSSSRPQFFSSSPYSRPPSSSLAHFPRQFASFVGLVPSQQPARSTRVVRTRGVACKVARDHDEHRDTVIEPDTGGHWSPGTGARDTPLYPFASPRLGASARVRVGVSPV